MALPKSHFIELTKADKIDKINKLDDEERCLANGDKLVEGAIYYQINTPSKYNDDEFEDTTKITTGASVTFRFNDDSTDVIRPAKEGTYSVNLYYVNSKNKLVKLGSNAIAINVKNSTPAVKAEGFKETNVCDGPIDADNIDKVLAEMYNFSWNGELLYDEARLAWSDGYSDNFEIGAVEADFSNPEKVIVKSITFKLDYFNDCEEDGNGGVTNNADENYQEVVLKKRITIKIDD